MQKLTLLLFIICNSAFAQTDTTVFSDLKKVELHDYVLPVPNKWKVIDQVDASTQEQKFDFTGIGIPETANGEALTALFSIRKYECANARTAEDYSLSDMTSYPDRITPKGYNYEKDTLHIASGERATLFSTHFYRQTKRFNFSLYNLVVYSKKRKAAYLINIIYKYKDTTYSLEKNLHLKEYALKIFKSLTLR